MRHIITTLSCAILLASPATTFLQAAPRAQQAPDNTGANKNDPGPTADQQKQNPNDRDITRQIRQALTKDKSLSTYAHNVKVISQNGMVTLRGPVRSEAEKQAVEMKAAEVAGKTNVTSELEVKPATP